MSAQLFEQIFIAATYIIILVGIVLFTKMLDKIFKGK